MNVAEFTASFFSMEEKHNLFGLKVDDIFWWDIVRYDVYFQLYYKMCGVPENDYKSDVNRTIPQLFNRLLNFCLLQIEIALRHKSVLFFRCARNRNGSSFVDIISDPLINMCSGNAFVINTYPSKYHYLPRVFTWGMGQYNCADLGNINDVVGRAFGGGMDFVPMISRKIHDFKREKRICTNLIKDISPKCVVLIQNGIQKATFSAARELNVPVVELQHGLVNRFHPAYSYSRNISYDHISTFPDYLLTLSDFWLKDCFYPGKRVLNIGSDVYYCEPKRILDRSCLIISANVYDNLLRPALKKIAGVLKDWTFIYKLHTNQCRDCDSIIQDLQSFPNVRVVSNQKSVKECLDQVSVVIAIQSTSVYESLQAGKLVLILKEYDYDSHQDVFSNSNVRLVSSEDEIVGTLVDFIPGTLQESPTIFFDKFKRQVVVDLFREFGLETSHQVVE